MVKIAVLLLVSLGVVGIVALKPRQFGSILLVVSVLAGAS